MVVKVNFFVSLSLVLFHLACPQPQVVQGDNAKEEVGNQIILPGAYRMEVYLPQLLGKKIALMVNHSSLVGQTHLVDTLLSSGVEVIKIFAPEHGFRGDAPDGWVLTDGVDERTGLPVISLYGKKKKASSADLADVDVVVFDIQDVGVRFYTYTSALSLMMEACAENGKLLILLDRPNPLGHYVDGPVLEPAFASYIGLHAVPVVYGMTIGEWANMVNGEGWLSNGVRCDLQIVPCSNYSHETLYELPVPPSPNLPNMRAVYLYPSLAFFEGTNISVGRGTSKPFQVIGAPLLDTGDYYFVPEPNAASKYPPHQGERCRGFDLSNLSEDELARRRTLDLSWLLLAYAHYREPAKFFLENNYFDKLAGTDSLRRQIQQGWTEEQIRASWQPALEKFLEKRKKYLLYPDFH